MIRKPRPEVFRPREADVVAVDAGGRTLGFDAGGEEAEVRVAIAFWNANDKSSRGRIPEASGPLEDRPRPRAAIDLD